MTPQFCAAPSKAGYEFDTAGFAAARREPVDGLIPPTEVGGRHVGYTHDRVLASKFAIRAENLYGRALSDKDFRLVELGALRQRCACDVEPRNCRRALVATQCCETRRGWSAHDAALKD